MTMVDDVPLTDEDFPDDPPLPPEVPEAQGDEDEAPIGLTVDRKTGELRPKLKPGRPRKPPSIEDLRAAGPLPPPTPDAPPEQGRRRKTKTTTEVAMPRGGIIAAGVNKLYRRAGKIVRAMDDDIGTAIIECAQDGDPDSVGVAWENLAKTDPRIRAFLLRALKGGAWTDLLLAHAPIGMALVMKPRVQAFLGRSGRMEKLVQAFTEEDGDTPGGMLGGLDEAAARAMAAQAGIDMEQVAARMEEMAASGNLPPGVTPRRAPNGFREQPKNRSRAQRSGKR